MESSFFDKGWCRFPFDPELAAWVRHSLAAARAAVAAPENAKWLRCGGTWFVGVHALPNDERGSVQKGPPLKGVAVDFIKHSLRLTGLEWDRAQISVCFPGYPRPMKSESETAYRYRCLRDAAHVDGLLPRGTARRRHLEEHHSIILGIPMVETDSQASPFVIWERSHEIVREAFRARLAQTPPDGWCNLDITDTYHETRRRIFDRCKRIELAAKPGEAYLAHRLTLHGIAPWRSPVTDYSDGRMICYFRPEFGEVSHWLTHP